LDCLRLSDFNLRVGYPSSFEIEAGSENSIYVEVNNPNSLVYIGFATMLNDITFHLFKYIAGDEENSEQNNENRELETTGTSEYDDNMTDKGHFKSILKLDRVDSSLNPIKVSLSTQNNLDILHLKKYF